MSFYTAYVNFQFQTYMSLSDFIKILQKKPEVRFRNDTDMFPLHQISGKPFITDTHFTTFK